MGNKIGRDEKSYLIIIALLSCVLAFILGFWLGLVISNVHNDKDNTSHDYYVKPLDRPLEQEVDVKFNDIDIKCK